MEARIFSNLTGECGVEHGDVIVTGVSGGADSMCLLAVLHHLGFNVIAAHFNHRLRQSAVGDARFVEAAAAERGIPFEYGEDDVTAFAKKERKSVEEAARILRYRFLMKAAEKHHSHFVAVAHNADDQVETFLMHLTRGSGLDGLSGMKYRTKIVEFHPVITVIRPLLSVWRSEIEEYLREKSLVFRLDESNLDQKYTRNQFRHDLLPYLRERFPNIGQKIWNTTSLLSGDQAIIEEQVQLAWQECMDERFEGFVRAERSAFLSHPPAIRRRILRRAAFQILPAARDVSFESIERVLQGIQTQENALIDLENKLVADVSGEAFVICRRGVPWAQRYYPQMSKADVITVPGTDIFPFGEGWALRVGQRSLEGNHYSVEKDYDRIAEFDLEKLPKFPWLLEKKSPGDRFTPFGRQEGSIKVGQFFINQKIPKSARANWPLVKDGSGKILWIVGLRASRGYEIGPQTRQVLVLELLRNETVIPESQAGSTWR